ncbi:MAG: phosphate ABC transporter permease subunit PstC [Gammaproteobacteria bacterium]
MSFTSIFIVVLLLAFSSYWLAWRKARLVAGGKLHSLHSRLPYYGYMSALWTGLPALLVMLLWISFETTIVSSVVMSDLPPVYQNLTEAEKGLLLNDVKNMSEGRVTSQVTDEMAVLAERYGNLKSIANAANIVVVLAAAIIGALIALRRIRIDTRARNNVEKIVKALLIFSSTIAIFTTVGIVLSVLFEAMRFFDKVSPVEFLFGLEWSPQMAIRADQVGSSGAFGMIPVFAGTMLISFIAMLVAVPIGLMSAIYLSEYAPRSFRSIAKPLMEVLAGIPTVVYGFFAALVVAPMVRDAGVSLGLSVSSESALAAGLVMGIMIIPFVSSLSDDVINAVPQSLRDGAYGLGSTQSETIRQVILPAALPGIVGGVLLAVSRAIGETMIVVMAAGLSANLTANPLEAVTTVTVQIVTLLVGDQEFDSPKTLAAFALGLTLFTVTLVLNVIALHIVRKYREQYD